MKKKYNSDTETGTNISAKVDQAQEVLLKKEKNKEYDIKKIEKKKRKYVFFEKMIKKGEKFLEFVGGIIYSPLVLLKAMWVFVKYHWPEITIISSFVVGWAALNHGDTLKPDKAEVAPVIENVLVVNNDGEKINESSTIMTAGLSFYESLPIGRVSFKGDKSYFDRMNQVILYSNWIDNNDGTYTRKVETYYNNVIDINEILEVLKNDSDNIITLKDIFGNSQVVQETKVIEDIDQDELSRDGYIKFITYDESKDKTITVSQTVEENNSCIVANVLLLVVLSGMVFMIRDLGRNITSLEDEKDDWEDALSEGIVRASCDIEKIQKYLQNNQSELQKIIDSLKLEIENGNTIENKENKKIKIK